MPNTGLVIASLINRLVVFISQQQMYTCFPLFSGPDVLQGTGPLVIAREGDDACAHFIYVMHLNEQLYITIDNTCILRIDEDTHSK